MPLCYGLLFLFGAAGDIIKRHGASLLATGFVYLPVCPVFANDFIFEGSWTTMWGDWEL